MAAQCKRILFARRELTDAKETNQRLELIGKCHGKAHRCRRKRIPRITRLIVLTDCKRNILGLFVVFGIVLAHNALQFRELTHHQGPEVGLGKHGSTIRFGLVGAKQGCRGRRNAANTKHALILAAELIVVNNMTQTLNTAFQRVHAVLIIEELRVRKTSTNHTGIAFGNGLAAVFGNELRNEQEAVHQLAAAILKCKVLLVELHRKNETFLRNREKFAFKLALINHRPFRKRGNFFQKVFRHDRFGIKRSCAALELSFDHCTAFIVARHDKRSLHLLNIAVSIFNGNRLARMEAMAARQTTRLQAEEFDRYNFCTQKRRQMTHRTHEGNRRYTVRELIGHHLGNRQMLHSIFERMLKS